MVAGGTLWHVYSLGDLGTVSFQEKGINDIELHPVRRQWTTTKVKTLKLEPVN